jgi:hypothetical protein
MGVIILTGALSLYDPALEEGAFYKTIVTIGIRYSAAIVFTISFLVNNNKRRVFYHCFTVVLFFISWFKVSVRFLQGLILNLLLMCFGGLVTGKRIFEQRRRYGNITRMVI